LHILLQGRPAPQQRLHPDGELGHGHGLDDIIVGAGLEIFQLAVQVAARGQHQRRHGVTIFAQALEEAGARAIRKLDIQDHQVVVIRLGIFQPVFGRQHTVHRIAFRLQAALEDVVELLFVLDDEDAHSGYLSRLFARAARGRKTIVMKVLQLPLSIFGL
jgi:hypothetical protein